MNKEYKIVKISPSRGTYYDSMGDTKELEEFLNKGWIIERETIVPSSCSSTNYTSLSSIIYILSIGKV